MPNTHKPVQPQQTLQSSSVSPSPESLESQPTSEHWRKFRQLRNANVTATGIVNVFRTVLGDGVAVLSRGEERSSQGEAFFTDMRNTNIF